MIGTVGSLLVHGAAARGVDSVLGPAGQTVHYAANASWPVGLPAIEQIIDMRVRGFIDYNTYVLGLKSHGCNVKLNDPLTDSGMSGLDKLTYNLWTGTYYAAQEVPSPAELLVMWNRGIIPDEATVDTMLQRNGIIAENTKSWYKQMAREIPGPSELVHFVLRHGFEPSVIAANRLNEEFPTSAKEWLAKQGLAYTFSVVDPFTGETADTTWADMYWQTHWVPIAPTQGYQMLQRLRPSRIDAIQRQVPDAKVFLLADLERWLRINDYPPGIRGNLAAISYVPINSSDARSLYRMSLVGPAELSELLQDNGYSETSANTIAGMEETIKQRTRATMSHGFTPGAIASAYGAGLMNDLDADQYMHDMGFTEEESHEMKLRAEMEFDLNVVIRARRKSVQDTEAAVIGAYKDGLMEIEVAVAELVKVGIPEQFARQILAAAEASATAALTNKAITRVRGAFLHGDITIEQAGEILTRLGVVAGRITQLTALWALELTPKRRMLARVDILRMVADGSLDIGTARARLVNLGWIEPDLQLLLAEAQGTLAKRQAAILAANDRKRAGQLRALDRIRKDAAAQANRALAFQKRLAPVASLKKWAKLGDITSEQFIERLRSYGYDNATISLHWQEACQAKGAVCNQSDPAIVALGESGLGPAANPPEPSPAS